MTRWITALVLLPVTAAWSTSVATSRRAVVLRSTPGGSEHWSQGGPIDFKGGAGVGRYVIDDTDVENVQCHYDMVLVERIQGKAKKDSGLFVPDDSLPRLHLCKVISMGSGREEESGLIAPMPDMKVGDVIVAKNPWGIGPKDEETSGGKKLSYMRSEDIAAVIEGGLVPEEA